MNIIYNCFAGISGDMNLAAMLDLGMDESLLRSELSKLQLDNEFELQVYPAAKSGINGTQVKVVLKEHHHHHHHDGHHHGHSHSHGRDYSNIKTLIDGSELDDEIKQLSKDIFWEVAIAEGKVHNKAPEDVHFHEVGAVDSIVDIVGAAICYHHLGVKQVVSTLPELGGGFVMCQHGKMPVPAPATSEILKGIDATTGAVEKEMTTPTGAAILKVLTDEFIASTDFKATKVAYGIGHRDVEIPNVLRVYEVAEVAKSKKKELIIECNIDDMTAEDLSSVLDVLLEQGAVDAYFTPIVMKKGRLATKLSALCPEDAVEAVSEAIFVHTTTIGLRSYVIEKTELPRRIVEKTVDGLVVKCKEVTLPSGDTRYKYEHNDLKALADKNGVSIADARKLLQ